MQYYCRVGGLTEFSAKNYFHLNAVSVFLSNIFSDSFFFEAFHFLHFCFLPYWYFAIYCFFTFFAAVIFFFFKFTLSYLHFSVAIVPCPIIVVSFVKSFYKVFTKLDEFQLWNSQSILVCVCEFLPHVLKPLIMLNSFYG